MTEAAITVALLAVLVGGAFLAGRRGARTKQERDDAEDHIEVRRRVEAARIADAGDDRPGGGDARKRLSDRAGR